MTVTAAASVELQKAIFAVLSDDANVEAALGTVAINGAQVLALFDLVPQEIINAYSSGEGPTYATFGQGSFDITPFDDDGSDDEEEFSEDEHRIAVHVFSRQVGLLEAKTIIGVISDAIKIAWKAGQIVLPHYQLKVLDPVSGEFGRQEDGFTSHGALVLRALISPK
jgi:hypothetical protein